MSERFGDKYAFLQFAKAAQSQQHDKARKWGDVLSGILTGDLKIGSRKPVTSMPVWATPEVIRGGFSTGACAAGGKLLPHEQELAYELGYNSSDVAGTRVALNEWFLSDVGLARLQNWITSNCYEADTPEEMALVCVAIIAEARPDQAREILAEIAPFFDRLRFYPRPLPRPRAGGLHVNSVQDVRIALKQVRPRKDILIQHASLTIWIPLYDRLMDLLTARESREWTDTAASWTKDYDVADKSHMAKRWLDADGAFQKCKSVLESLLAGEPVSRRDEGYANLQTTRHTEKYGLGAAREAYRDQQRHQAIALWHDALAELSLERLAGMSELDGISELELLLKPVSSGEAREGAPANAELPQTIKRKIGLARVGSVSELIEGGQITSPETLGAILPKLTSEVYSRAFPNAAIGAAYANIYRAFHQRRSLLLLNLESQVKLDELPWARALTTLRTVQSRDASPELELLDELVQHTLIHFPHTQFPNPLIEQMQDLGKPAGIATPFVSELAADIFMGNFSKNFEAVAAATLRHFNGTLYARYYDLPTGFSAGGFAKLCFERAGSRPSQGWSVAYNGMVLEQAMILTSHNLATVFQHLSLKNVDYHAAALRCFDWVCGRLQLRYPSHHAKLIALKQSAYAWRQMVAFLAQLDDTEQRIAWSEMLSIFESQKQGFQIKMAPFIDGLELAIGGEQQAAAPFLGWTVSRHPLLQD
jgi:hypothetical protein